MARVIVYHGYYGCETGCCGHIVELLEDGQEKGYGKDKFEFHHPWGEKGEEALKKFAEEMVRDEFGEEHVKDLDWEHCNVTVNC